MSDSLHEKSVTMVPATLEISELNVPQHVSSLYVETDMSTKMSRIEKFVIVELQTVMNPTAFVEKIVRLEDVETELQIFCLGRRVMSDQTTDRLPVV